MKSDTIFSIFYYLITLIIYILSLPFLILLSLKSKYKKSIPARFFLYKNPPFVKNRIWFHACSLGETRALKPVLDNFDEVNISVITNTGYAQAKKNKNADVRFLPFEIFLPFWVKPCKALVVMEAELWYMLFYVAKKRCEKTVLINARISEKSFPKYLKFRWFYKRVFKNIDIVLAQSAEDKKRLEALGAENVEVTGNIKTFFKPEITTDYQKNKKLVVIASTHPGEEKIIMDNIDYKSYQIVVVPRHPERFEEVFETLKTYGNVSKISEICSGNECELRDDLILCDKMGELVNLYKVADAVILGGSFVDNVGGHNPVEAAYFQKPIISGKYIFNQKALYNEIEGIVQCEPCEINKHLKSPVFTKIKNRTDINKIVKLIKG